MLLVWPGFIVASTLRLETEDLIVVDATGRISDERLRELSVQVQDTLDKVLVFWSIDSAVNRFGKIRVIFDSPRRRGYYTAVVQLAYREKGRAFRAVRVYGYDRKPQEVAHKLTHALFMREDKLVRNMIGIATEERVGNPLSWPACGFVNDEWVLALLRIEAYIPLSELGPDHESWGMRADRDGMPYVVDRSKQSRAYAEAGSFGSYLVRTYGTAKLKQFYDMTGRATRPWHEVFGTGLQKLEADWLKTLQTGGRGTSDTVVTLSRLFEQDPSAACLQAQRLAIMR